MNIFRPGKTFLCFAVQNVCLTACLIAISLMLRWDPRILVGVVDVATLLLSAIGVGVEWLLERTEDESDDE